MAHYTPIVPPGRPVKFRRSVVIVGLAAVLGIVAYALIDVEDPSTQVPPDAQATTMKPAISGVVAGLPQGYQDMPAEEPPPPPPQEQPRQEPPAPPAEPKAPPPQSPADRQGHAQRQRQTPAKAPEPKRWLIAKSNVQKPPFERPKGLAGTPDAETGLLKPAKWVTPVHPERVLYPEQVIPALTLQALNSDVPGTLRLMVTQDVMDLQTGNTVLIPQFSTITSRWDEQPKYGDKRARIKLHALRMHGTGTLVDLTGGIVGGRDGASGIEAKVNNHWPHVLAGAGISALLSIGARAPFGNVEGYAPSLAQEFAQDVGSGLNKAGQKVVERELMRAPTLTQAAGYPVTVQLSEAISFQQPPKRSGK